METKTSSWLMPHLPLKMVASSSFQSFVYISKDIINLFELSFLAKQCVFYTTILSRLVYLI